MNEQAAISLLEQLSLLYHNKKIISGSGLSPEFLRLIGDADDLISNVE